MDPARPRAAAFVFVSKLLAALLLFALVACRSQDPPHSTRLQAPSSPAGPRRAQVEVRGQDLLERGVLGSLCGDILSAEELAPKSHRGDRELAQAHLRAALASWQQGEVEAARRGYERALRADPSSLGAILGLTCWLQSAGLHTRARQIATSWYQAALAEIPGQACRTDEDCGPGSCGVDTARCQVPEALDLVLVLRLRSELAQLDTEAMLASAVLLDADEQLPLHPGLVSRLQAFEPLIEVEGERGRVHPILLADDLSAQRGPGRVDGVETQLIFAPAELMSHVGQELSTRAKLEHLGPTQPGGPELVVLNRVELGGLDLRCVPALVSPHLDEHDYELILGQQVLQGLGAVTWDHPRGELSIEATAPAVAPWSAIELPLVLIHTDEFEAPLVPLRDDATEHPTWLWLGGRDEAHLSLRESHGPELGSCSDASTAVLDLRVGPRPLGLLCVALDADLGWALRMIEEQSGFPAAGYLNHSLLASWRLTYVPSRGRVWIDL